jgi:hypothetical protein
MMKPSAQLDAARRPTRMRPRANVLFMTCLLVKEG